MKTKQEVITFITTNMTWIGFGNYMIAIKEVKKLDSLAMIEVSEMGQQLIFTLPLSFYKSPEVIQVNILLHELIHGRESLRKQRVDKYTETIMDEEEEKCMNDITLLAQKWRK